MFASSRVIDEQTIGTTCCNFVLTYKMKNWKKDILESFCQFKQEAGQIAPTANQTLLERIDGLQSVAI